MAAMMSMSTGIHYPTKPDLKKRSFKASASTRIHRLIEEQGAVLMPGCYDALSAAIVEKSGFSAGFISGYALSASLLGKPDFGLLTPPEMAETARFVCAAAPGIPIIADAEEVLLSGSPRVWSPSFRRPLSDLETSNFLTLSSLLQSTFLASSGSDQIIWTPSPSGRFSVASFYKKLMMPPTFSLSPRSIVAQAWSSITPPKVQALIWIVISQKALTVDHLQHRGVPIPKRCAMCLTDEESNSHLFIHSQLAFVGFTAPTLRPQLGYPSFHPGPLLSLARQVWVEHFETNSGTSSLPSPETLVTQTHS
ncbi:uncharacterized protein LOC18432227 isoform X2 [Amborella trichopoda]|uniref:uncharacterized protein LOC18432227 isoform X2 n=1 Tax=Amborella trichopoda TaxID=13333 RepID=UPI0009BFD078|nr:uncharacterized protein LOC18432227 isoform X2 [Amborella trichopoda]|eukprot:XP_020521660.1 uncharacterized protein LOC18432227 isoform X2 [Amborella trichopoda]